MESDPHGSAETVPTFRKLPDRARAPIFKQLLHSGDYLRVTSLRFPFADNFRFYSAAFGGMKQQSATHACVMEKVFMNR